MKSDRLKTTSLDELIDKHIGEVGTEKRDAFEEELRLDILGFNAELMNQNVSLG